MDVPNTASASAVPSTPVALSSDLIDQLVSRVTVEVTKQISSLLPGPHHNSASLTEVPLVDPAGLVPPTADAVVADAVVQDVIQQTHVSLTGEPGVTPSSSLPSELFTSVSVPVDARVPLKLKSKIWNHEYIDFGHLLVNPTLEGKFQLTLQNSDATSSPSLSFESVTKPKKIYSIDTWLPAFHVFVGVYTSRYPTEAPSLMKYGEIVQDLAVRGHNWRFYDENFRFLRQTQSSTLPWGAVHFELWLRSQQGSSKRNSGSLVPNNGKLGRLLNVPNGYCYKFHKGVDCPGCNYKHACFKWEGAHQAIRCTFRGPNRNSDQLPLPAKSSLANTSKQ